MKIEDLEKTLIDMKSRGLTHVARDFFGTYDIAFCKGIKNQFFGPNNFYILLLGFSDEWLGPESDEPINEAKIKVKIIDYDFERDKEGGISMLFTLEPIGELPDWYKDDNKEDFNAKYYEDFNRVPLEFLYADPL